MVLASSFRSMRRLWKLTIMVRWKKRLGRSILKEGNEIDWKKRRKRRKMELRVSFIYPKSAKYVADGAHAVRKV